MSGIKIEVGGVYTHEKEVFAREVLKITEDGMVHYRYYGLSDGAIISEVEICSVGRFQTWISRPLTSEERAGLQKRTGPSASEVSFVRQLIDQILKTATDEEIREEARRRGLKLD